MSDEFYLQFTESNWYKEDKSHKASVEKLRVTSTNTCSCLSIRLSTLRRPLSVFSRLLSQREREYRKF